MDQLFILKLKLYNMYIKEWEHLESNESNFMASNFPMLLKDDQFLIEKNTC